jgi:hypothetical protein
VGVKSRKESVMRRSQSDGRICLPFQRPQDKSNCGWQLADQREFYLL